MLLVQAARAAGFESPGTYMRQRLITAVLNDLRLEKERRWRRASEDRKRLVGEQPAEPSRPAVP
jgi:hypothetical protein